MRMSLIRRRQFIVIAILVRASLARVSSKSNRRMTPGLLLRGTGEYLHPRELEPPVDITAANIRYFSFTCRHYVLEKAHPEHLFLKATVRK
jgi:hypothetical protein